jgi:energy-coupling factor transporter ATP-binding protein EcfA2
VKLAVRHQSPPATSYRAARVRSLFNAPEHSEGFELDAELPAPAEPWQVGLIVGPSGSGKTSLGRLIFDGLEHEFYGRPGGALDAWPATAPIVDGIAPQGSFDDVTGALSAVGLGDVPAWLRPYSALSMGQQFRADLARLISEAPERVVIDEFTSVVDRQIAKVGASAFAKAWRRTQGQAVLLSCHHDIIEWVQPDWVYDTGTREFRGREGLQPRPRIEVEIWRTSGAYWPLFEPHHYLKLPPMIGGAYYVGFHAGEPIAHICVATKNRGKQVEARACRMVILPEWQGAGVGMRFLNAVCELQRQGHPDARLPGRKVNSTFHTSHPGLCAALRRDPRWRQLSAVLHGSSKAKSRASLEASLRKGNRASYARTGQVGMGGPPKGKGAAFSGSGFGGHMRAVQGFRYYGPPA